MEIEIPSLDNEIIRKKADDFRRTLAPEGCALPPLDVVYVVEVILRLDIIDLPDLFREQHIDAALLPDLSGLYVDREELQAWDKKDHWTERRLRFSVAHEIGHYVLHGEIMKNFFPTLEAFKKWAGNRENYGSAEYQADEFAGRLLVPRDILLKEYDLYCQKADAADPEWRNVEGMREHVARKLSPRFGVNHQVIETRLDHENIWPAD